ncbi:hypothetical protein EVAR_20432_1 [Eumeta japonica]|uniref:Uncharacterized protein n=1 Tax=Eumeta variegata TaxID=151549 RepID=A0A4C1TY24_EUMVA|nr:hypothetical protein EVAR_20432_1 [Eumeta japonica]
MRRRTRNVTWPPFAIRPLNESKMLSLSTQRDFCRGRGCDLLLGCTGHRPRTEQRRDGDHQNRCAGARIESGIEFFREMRFAVAHPVRCRNLILTEAILTVPARVSLCLYECVGARASARARSVCVCVCVCVRVCVCNVNNIDRKYIINLVGRKAIGTSLVPHPRVRRHRMTSRGNFRFSLPRLSDRDHNKFVRSCVIHIKVCIYLLWMSSALAAPSGQLTLDIIDLAAISRMTPAAVGTLG